MKLQPGEKVLLMRAVKVAGRWGLPGPGLIALTQERLFLREQGVFLRSRVRVIPRGLLFDVRPNENREGWVAVRYAEGPETRVVELAPAGRAGAGSAQGPPMTAAARAADLADAIRGLQRGDLKAEAPAIVVAGTTPSSPAERAKKQPSLAGLVAEVLVAVGILDRGIEAVARGGSPAELLPGLVIVALIGYHAYRIYRARPGKSAGGANASPVPRL